MRVPQVENGVVIAVLEFDVVDLTLLPGLVPGGEHANVGDLYDEDTGTFSPPPPPPAPIPTEGELMAMCRSVLSIHLDAGARGTGFLNFADALTYVDEPAVPAYQAAALELRAWRSQCRAAADQVMADIRTGAAPTDEEIIAVLPPAPYQADSAGD